MRELNQYYQLYKCEWQNESNSWKKWSERESKQTKKENKRIYIKPERVSSRSPLTILHGPWGSGKTFFVEKLVKEWQGASKGTEFENIIVIDLWNYIHHTTNIVLEMANQFYGIILDFLPLKHKKELKRRQFWKMMLTNFASSLEQNTKSIGKLYRSGKYFYKLLANGKFSNKLSHRQKIEKIVENLKPTVVFFDNIERLESYSIEIIKVIQFFSFLPNFVFVLPMNKSELKFTASTLDTNGEIYGEAAIDKYVTLGVWFDYKQDYSQFLQKIGFPEKIIPELNRSLSLPQQTKTKISYILSIRQLEKIFKQEQYKKIIDKANQDKYLGFLLLDEMIWPNDVIEKDVSIFFEYHSNLTNRLEQINSDNDWISIESSNYFNTEKMSSEIRNKIELIQKFSYYICDYSSFLYWDEKKSKIPNILKTVDMLLNESELDDESKEKLTLLKNKITCFFDLIPQITKDYPCEKITPEEFSFIKMSLKEMVEKKSSGFDDYRMMQIFNSIEIKELVEWMEKKISKLN